MTTSSRPAQSREISAASSRTRPAMASFEKRISFSMGFIPSVPGDPDRRIFKAACEAAGSECVL